MHKYLRAVGFSQIEKKQEEEDLLSRMEEEYSFCSFFTDSRGGKPTELDITLAPGMGVILRGNTEGIENFHREYYFPYAVSDTVTTESFCEVDRKMDQDGYSCMCDEPKLGISLIFHMINSHLFSRTCMEKDQWPEVSGCCLSALSVKGKILLPLMKSNKQMQTVDKNKRTALMEAARQGDEAAIENLTLQDMNLIANVNRRIMKEKEDLYSILDTVFMPVGIECDEYSIVANILNVDKLENKWTEEKCYKLFVECNDLRFPVIINEKDLIGEPAPGRRFKGEIWMQGTVKLKEK